MIDFHAHLRGAAPVKPSDLGQVPYVKELADWAEPLTRQVAGLAGTHLRDPLSRLLYRGIHQYAHAELARVFEKTNTATLLAAMEKEGFQHAVISPLEPLVGTADLAGALAAFPRQFSLFATADPASAEAIPATEALLRAHPIRGLKIDPARIGAKVEEQRFSDLLALAHERALPVFLHPGTFPFEANGFDDPAVLGPILARFPRVSVTIAHIGWDRHQTVLAMAERLHHLSVETSWQPPKVIRQAVDKLGAHRVLLGSDYPLLTPAAALDHARQALTAGELKIVAQRNAGRLLGVGER